jgi:large subunit ribosomal protein L24
LGNLKSSGDRPREFQLQNYSITRLQNQVYVMTTATTAHKTVDIRRNDTVKVLSGKDKGKQGRVLRVFPDTGRVLVEHVAVVKKHLRPSQRSKGGIADQESAISISKVQLVCGTCGPVRVGHEVRGDRKVRVCRKCGTTLDKT